MHIHTDAFHLDLTNTAVTTWIQHVYSVILFCRYTSCFLPLPRLQILFPVSHLQITTFIAYKIRRL